MCSWFVYDLLYEIFVIYDNEYRLLIGIVKIFVCELYLFFKFVINVL